MSQVQFTTRDGSPWVPRYLSDINRETCIGCARCYKVCTHGVMKMMGVNEDGELVDPEDEDEEIERKVMIIDTAGNCIGCAACAQVCAKKCQTHAPLEAA